MLRSRLPIAGRAIGSVPHHAGDDGDVTGGQRTVPDRGAPDRGAPDRGAPDRGAPDRARALRADELAVLALLAKGLPLETVARQLDVSERTLRRRTRAICDALGVPAAITAVAWAARQGLL